VEYVQTSSLYTDLKHIRPSNIIFTLVSVWLSVAQLQRGVRNFELWPFQQILQQYLLNLLKPTGHVMHQQV